ncbi:DUF6779 domain-containing protein [Corynebacterium anserum]|uniref:Uncharacterized protein n=1 Tax=Corynebacterium anserum TaxID=2684406 RepID=A0A7G7YM10_9CORY|nr:DUF6779 domain-containing protein [Corynebacterium anserum]MBC2681294.1 hypothetical protein [Corynebacterium anserum]QNH95530.1 hypothetical protein GP473_01400 [Corynebacterium anserum]
MSFQPQPQQSKSRHKDMSRTNTSKEGGMSKLLMGGLIVLALIASVLMLFLDSEVWLKIAVIAALWAAFLGAVLVNRYSSALSAERDRSRQLQRTHSAELAREKSQAKEREAQLKSSYEQRFRDQRDEHIEALQQELAAMRQQLSLLSGGKYGTEEQTSVHARAERVREIGGGSARSAQPAGATVTPKSEARKEESRQAGASSSQPAGRSSGGRAPSFSTGSFSAIKWDGQNKDETTELPLVVDTTALDEDSSRPASEQSSQQSSQPAARSGGSAKSKGERPAYTQFVPGGQRSKEAAVNHHSAHQTKDAASGYVGGHRRKDEAHEADQRRGRRRADEANNGLTVAELMARFKRGE